MQTFDNLLFLETGIQAITNLLLEPTPSHKSLLLRDHRIAFYLDSITFTASQISFNKQIVGDFYSSLKDIKELYRRNPSSTQSSLSHDHITLDSIDVLFTGQESLGKYLDLNWCFSLYTNLLPDPSKTDYISYIRMLGRNWINDNHLKKRQGYIEYLDTLSDYLSKFIRNSQPLFDIATLDSNTRAEFMTRQMTSNVEFVKDLFCTPCNKQFANSSVYNGHLSGKKHLKNSERDLKGKSRPESLENRILEVQFRISAYLTHLESTVRDTASRVEAISVLTDTERQVMMEEEEEGATEVIIDETSFKDIDDKIFNPLNVPLGWDGKPIPLWLFKLHGLGVEYPCEICGGYVYMGRRSYDRHFTEYRHTYGLKCLGIENEKRFYGIVKIDDAYSCIFY